MGEQREDDRIKVRFLIGNGDPEEWLARREAERLQAAGLNEAEFIQPKVPGRYTLAAGPKPPEPDAEAPADDSTE